MFCTIEVIGAALVNGAIGISAMVRPVNLLQGFSIAADAPESRNEIRAAYGGLPLTISTLLIFSLTRPDISNAILFAVTACSKRFSIGRVISAVIDRPFRRVPILWTALELVVAAMIASNISGF
jgi:hypothetical protein